MLIREDADQHSGYCSFPAVNLRVTITEAHISSLPGMGLDPPTIKLYVSRISSILSSRTVRRGRQVLCQGTLPPADVDLMWGGHVQMSRNGTRDILQVEIFAKLEVRHCLSRLCAEFQIKKIPQRITKRPSFSSTFSSM